MRPNKIFSFLFPLAVLSAVVVYLSMPRSTVLAHARSPLGLVAELVQTEGIRDVDADLVVTYRNVIAFKARLGFSRDRAEELTDEIRGILWKGDEICLNLNPEPQKYWGPRCFSFSAATEEVKRDIATEASGQSDS